ESNRDRGFRRRQSGMVAVSLPPSVPSARGHVCNFALRLNALRGPSWPEGSGFAPSPSASGRSYEDRHVSARECALPARDRRRSVLALAGLFTLKMRARRSVAQLVRAPVSKTG